MEKYAATHIMKLLYIFSSEKKLEKLPLCHPFYRTHVVGEGKRQGIGEFMGFRSSPSFVKHKNMLCRYTSGCFYLNFKCANSDIKMKYSQIPRFVV
jgi:hypothetical protein